MGKYWKRIGRKNTTIGINVQKQNYQNGSVKGLARKGWTLNPPMTMLKVQLLISGLKRMKMKRSLKKRRRKKRRKRKKKRRKKGKRRKKKRKKKKNNKIMPRPCVQNQPTNADQH